MLAFWENGQAWLWLARWPSHSATYAIDASVPAGFNNAINVGANTWTDSAASTWKWTNDTPASGNKVKYQAIDGPGRTLAETAPSPFLVVYNFDLRIDTAENWYSGAGSPGANQWDLQSITTHEFGHALGLGHSETDNCPANTATNPTMCEHPQIGTTYWRTLANDDTSGLQYLYPPLTQLFWRSNTGYSRQVAIVSGAPDFNQAQAWTTPPSSGGNPGSGDVQAWASVVISGTLYQEMWQNNTRWRRTVPIVGGIEQWASASAWVSGLANFGTQPGSGDTQANNAYVIGSKLYQGYWRGDQGFSRIITVTNGVPDWSTAPTTWSGPVLTNTLPGTGSLQALSIYKISSTNMRQGIWRNNFGYSRTITYTSAGPDWNNAGPWSDPIPIDDLGAGSGDMRAQDNYALLQ